MKKSIAATKIRMVKSSVAHKVARHLHQLKGFKTRPIAGVLQHMVKAVALDPTLDIARICPFQPVLPIYS